MSRDDGLEGEEQGTKAPWFREGEEGDTRGFWMPLEAGNLDNCLPESILQYPKVFNPLQNI